MKIGTDEWVAAHEERREADHGPLAPVRRARDRVPVGGQLGIVLTLGAVFPLLHPTLYLIHIGLFCLLYALLALGLNVTVGFTGMLDLGYIAFFGFGAYVYAELSSPLHNINWPVYVTVPLVVAATALLGLLVGLPSRRLAGDYLAIVTLFFGQLFVQLTTTLGVTGGANGIDGVDPMHILGWHLLADQDYYYLSLIVFAAVMVALYHLLHSRTGRAWIALREDPIAAELMSVPVNRMRLLAFSIGAAIAGLTGTIFAADQIFIGPTDFDLPLLILIYAAVVLGGTGSLPGVVLGALFIVILPEILRSTQYANLLFFLLIAFAVIRLVHPWQRLLAVLAATLALGEVVHAIAQAVWPKAIAPPPSGSGAVTGAIDRWVVLLANPGSPGLLTDAAFIGLLAGVLALTIVRTGLRRDALLVAVLYLAFFVWENMLVPNPSITRQLLIGAMLVVVMTMRPQGLLGTFRVEPV